MWASQLFCLDVHYSHCVKSVCIQIYSGPHFLEFGLNAERYSVSLRIQSECGKMRSRITRNTYTFDALFINYKSFIRSYLDYGDNIVEKTFRNYFNINQKLFSTMPLNFSLYNNLYFVRIRFLFWKLNPVNARFSHQQ